MLAPPNVETSADATDLAHARIEQTLLGIVIWLVVSTSHYQYFCNKEVHCNSDRITHVEVVSGNPSRLGIFFVSWACSDTGLWLAASLPPLWASRSPEAVSLSNGGGWRAPQVEFGLWPRRATDEALAAVHAALVAASAAARAVADVDLAALDAAYARRSPHRRLDRSGGEDGEENHSGGEGGGEDALASPAAAAAAAFPSLANPLGLFGDDCAAAVDGDEARRPSASAAPAAPALLGKELRLRRLPVLRQSAAASLQAPPPLSPLPYIWAPPSPRPSPPPTNCAFSAADASAPAAAALAKVSKGLRYIQGALVLV